MELSAAASGFAELGLALVGVTYDPPEQQARFTARHGIAFPIYSDVDSEAIRALGLLNETMTSGTKYFGVPWPGIFILDKDLKIVAKLAEEDYRARPTVEALLEAAAQSLPRF